MKLCDWCRDKPTAKGQKFCGRKCRQSAHRLRKRLPVLSPQRSAENRKPMRMLYADPPYPGLSARYYKAEDTYGGEVDHAQLIRDLERVRLGLPWPEGPGASLVNPLKKLDGWALSTAARDLRWILPLCPEDAHVCPWVKPIGVPTATKGLHYTWEPLIIVGGRQRAPGVRDWLCGQPARFGGELMGRKPLAFCSFLFEALGLAPGDELVDLFPGTGIVGRAWAELSTRPEATQYELAGMTASGRPVFTGKAKAGKDESQPALPTLKHDR